MRGAPAVEQNVYRSEAETGTNRAIAHLLRNFDVVETPEEALDLYFRQCAISIDCSDLARSPPRSKTAA